MRGRHKGGEEEIEGKGKMNVKMAEEGIGERAEERIGERAEERIGIGQR